MARLTPRRRMWTTVGALFGITAVTVGAWGLRSWAPFEHHRAAVSWPKNVQPLVDFVQSETGQRFTTAVTVRFAPDTNDFRSQLPQRARTDDALATLRTDAALGRALGYWSGDVDLGAAADTVRAASEFASSYLSASHTMLLGVSNGDTALSPVQRADVIVTLAAILDDQQFDVVRRLSAIRSTQRFDALAGVHLGQMAWLHDRYIRRFNTADRTTYDAAIARRGTTFATATTHVPRAFTALRSQTQLLGRAFVASLHARQPDGITAAFTSDVPTALDQLEMPIAKYAHRDTSEAVNAPPVPEHARLITHRQLGPFGVYLILAGGLSPTEALTASDGWGNDAITVYRTSTKVCVDGRIVADTSADADRLERGLNAWGHARPPQADALVGRRGSTLLFSVCDPGPDAQQTVVADAVVNQFYGRAGELDQQVTANGQPTRSECIAVSAFADHLAGDLNPTIIDDAAADCDSSV